MKRRRNTSGFLFTEMLVIIGLLAVVALVSSRLFSASMRSIITARTSEDHQMAMSNMSAALRRDVWTATKISAPDAQTILLPQSDNTNVRWHFEKDGAVRAIASNGSNREQHWAIPNVQAQLEGASITLRTISKSGEQTTSRFINPMMLSAESSAR